MFTPRLKQFYESVQANNINIEIVFVSSDNTEGDMMSYFEGEHGDYLAVKYSDPARQQLGQELGVRGIPALFVVNKLGAAVVDSNACRAAVASGKALDYVDDWRKAAGDWTALGGGQKLGGSSSASTRPKTREELRKARLEAMKRKKEAGDTIAGTKDQSQDESKNESRSSIPPLDKVELLSSMGFSVIQAKKALDATNHDFDTALEILLNQ